MQLFALALVNLLTALGFYLWFSWRTRQAIAKIRKQPFTPELKENIELTVQFINASLELLDQKKKSCYQMLRQAEKAISKLEKEVHTVTMLDERKDVPLRNQSQSTKTTRVRNNKTTEKTPRATDNTANQAATPSVFHDFINHRLQSQSHEKKSKDTANDTHIQRVLSRIGEDRLELTPLQANAKDAYLMGASSSQRAIPKSVKKQKDTKPSIWYWLEKFFTPKTIPSKTLLKAKQNNPHHPSSKESSVPIMPVTSRAVNGTPSAPPPLTTLDIDFPKQLSEKIVLIQGLLKQSYTKEEISRAAEIPLAELSLMASLPQLPQKRPRKHRLENTLF